MTPTKVVNIQDAINSAPISRFQWFVLGCCFLVVTVDGFDTAAIGFIAPAIREQWQLDAAHLAPLFGAGMLGLALGAMIFGPLADRLGRKTILIWSVIVFGTASLVSALATNMDMLLALRFVTGLGLGGAMPNAITLTAEFMPEKKRSGLITAMFCGFTLGSALGGIISAQLVPFIGWEGILVLGGVSPLALAVLLLYLPESPRYWVHRGDADHKIAPIMARITGQDQSGTTYSLPERKSGENAIAALFRQKLASVTLLLWGTCFMSLLIVYLLTSWLPTLLTDSGIDLSHASIVAAAFQIGGTVGALTVGQIMDRVNPFITLGASYALGGLFIILLGQANSSLMLLTFAVFGAGLCVSGAQVGVNALSAALYPTACRATGVAWANAIGRGGAIFGSVVGGIMLSWRLGFDTMFLIMAGPAFIATIALLLLGRYVNRSDRESYWSSPAPQRVK